MFAALTLIVLAGTAIYAVFATLSSFLLGRGMGGRLGLKEFFKWYLRLVFCF